MVNSEKASDTEQLILQSAEKIFYKKGYDGTRMQEIADDAGINKAMLHYYFRSKDKLFEKIFKVAAGIIFRLIVKSLDSDKTIEEKVYDFVGNYIDFVKTKPFLPSFILHEINHNPERFQRIFGETIKQVPENFIRQLENEMKKGKIKKCDPVQLILNLISLIIFPLAAKPLICGIFELSNKEYSNLIEERKKLIPEFYLSAVKNL